MHTLFQRSLSRARATSQRSEDLFLFVSLSKYIINLDSYYFFLFYFLLSDLQMTLSLSESPFFLLEDSKLAGRQPADFFIF